MEESNEKKLTKEEEIKENPNQEQNIEIEDKKSEETMESKEETALVECKKKKRRKGNYITGTFGAIFGGCVAAMAWILPYMFFNHMVIPIFGTLIPFGAYLGYKIFRGKVGRAFPVLITIISLLIIILVTTVICPIVLIMQAGYPINTENFLAIYVEEIRADVREVVVEDIIAGSIFTIIGIIVIIASFIRKELRNLISEEERKLINEKAVQELETKSEIVKKICVTLNCMKKENAKKKKMIINELKNTYNMKKRKAKEHFGLCKTAKILRRTKGKYYYDENDEKNKIQNARKINKKYKVRKRLKCIFKLLITAILISVILIGIIIVIQLNTKTLYKISNTDIEITTNGLQNLYGTQEEMSAEFGAQIASYYDFIIIDKAEKYEIEGKTIDKVYYQGIDIDTIINADRDYCIQVTNETMSEITEKKFGNIAFKTYNYSYNGNDNERYLAVVYLHETENSYLWIFAYADTGVEVNYIDKVVEKMFK